MMKSSEAATGGVLYETVFLEISQNSQGARVSTRIFSCEFCEISKNTFFIDPLWASASESYFLFFL